MQGRHVEHGTGTSRRHYRLRWTHRWGLGRRQFRRARPRCSEAIPLRGRDRTLAGDTRVLVHFLVACLLRTSGKEACQDRGAPCILFGWFVTRGDASYDREIAFFG